MIARIALAARTGSDPTRATHRGRLLDLLGILAVALAAACGAAVRPRALERPVLPLRRRRLAHGKHAAHVLACCNITRRRLCMAEHVKCCSLRSHVHMHACTLTHQRIYRPVFMCSRMHGTVCNSSKGSSNAGASHTKACTGGATPQHLGRCEPPLPPLQKAKQLQMLGMYT